jgi:hypothetical protein
MKIAKNVFFVMSILLWVLSLASLIIAFQTEYLQFYAHFYAIAALVCSTTTVVLYIETEDNTEF